MHKFRVAIIYGGPSSEHEVSVSSAKNVLEAIDRTKYEVLEVFIPKDGAFDITTIKGKCDVVFPVLHGAFGEDGKLQAILEKEKIPFVGSGSVASALAMDKHASNKIFLENGVPIPKSVVTATVPDIFYPVIVKPVNEGSSVGLKKCESKEELEKFLSESVPTYGPMLVQEFIQGREFTCWILEHDGKNIALPPTEIILSSGLFDYHAKYTPGKTTEITPAEVDAETLKEIKATALKCHELLGCKSMSRTDMILSGDTLYVLETNTLPGMTSTSFVPQQAKAYGLTMTQVIDILIQSRHT